MTLLKIPAFSAASSVYAEMASSLELQSLVADVVDLIVDALNADNKVLFIGNGGSAADCQHMAGEFVSRFMFDRNPLPAIALTTDSSIITAIANDYGYEKTFSRQVEGIASPGDVLFAYSTSGNSLNVIKALETAALIGVASVGLTGSQAGQMEGRCDKLIKVPSSSVPRIQEGHLLIGHIICEMVEQRVFRS